MEEIRSFIAIELSENIATGLTRVQNGLKESDISRAVKWVNPHSIHLTLKFLGNVPAAQIAAIEEALTPAVAPFAPFTLTAEELGCFPNARRPRVVWVGVHGDLDTLKRLQNVIEGAVAPLGYPPEDRPFRAHLTLGRVRRRVDKATVRQLGELIKETMVGKLGEMQVTGVSLMRSDLRPTGAVYTQLAHAALRG